MKRSSGDCLLNCSFLLFANAKKQDFTINWSILKCVAPRAAGRNTCNLCLEEKLSILESNSARLLNKRSELFSKCRHRLSLVRETLNARAIEMSRQTSVRCMAFANNKKEQLSRQSPEDRFIA